MILNYETFPNLLFVQRKNKKYLNILLLLTNEKNCTISLQHIVHTKNNEEHVYDNTPVLSYFFRSFSVHTKIIIKCHSKHYCLKTVVISLQLSSVYTSQFRATFVFVASLIALCVFHYMFVTILMPL